MQSKEYIIQQCMGINKSTISTAEGQGVEPCECGISTPY